MFEEITTKTSGRQVVVYKNKNELYAIGTRKFESYYNIERYEYDEIPINLKSDIIKNITGIEDDNPELIFFGNILFHNNQSYLTEKDVFFLDYKTETVSATKNFIDCTK